MKKILRYAVALTMVISALSAWSEPTDHLGRWLANDYDLEEIFDPNEIRKLVDIPDRDAEENRRLMMLIVRAAIEKDRSFDPLLSRKDLRRDTFVDLALSAYDFMLNKNDRALDHILAHLAIEPVGDDTLTIVILSAVDEWDRTIKAFRKHFFRTDGAGATCYYSFRETRQYLYPDRYSDYRDVIESHRK